MTISPWPESFTPTHRFASDQISVFVETGVLGDHPAQPQRAKFELLRVGGRGGDHARGRRSGEPIGGIEGATKAQGSPWAFAPSRTGPRSGVLAQGRGHGTRFAWETQMNTSTPGFDASARNDLRLFPPVSAFGLPTAVLIVGDRRRVGVSSGLPVFRAVLPRTDQEPFLISPRWQPCQRDPSAFAADTVTVPVEGSAARTGDILT